MTLLSVEVVLLLVHRGGVITDCRLKGCVLIRNLTLCLLDYGFKSETVVRSLSSEVHVFRDFGFTLPDWIMQN